MHDPSLQMWLLARTSGIVAYLLLTLAVVAGLTIKAKVLGRTVPMPAVLAMHQLASTLGLTATVLHVALIVADTKVDIPLFAALVPGLSGYRTVATALGVVALELWVLVHFSFAVRKRIGVHRWRSLHKLTFAVWGLAAVHGLAAGSDSGRPFMHELYAGTAALVVGLVAWRVLSAAPPRPRRDAAQ